METVVPKTKTEQIAAKQAKEDTLDMLVQNMTMVMEELKDIRKQINTPKYGQHTTDAISV